jgi:hypothetical protein
MRGPDEQTSHMFSYLSPEQRVRPDHPLRAIRRMTDEVLTSLSPRFTKMYADMGRPSIPPEQLLRAHTGPPCSLKIKQRTWRLTVPFDFRVQVGHPMHAGFVVLPKRLRVSGVGQPNRNPVQVGVRCFN